jgi:hypothetical protein
MYYGKRADIPVDVVELINIPFSLAARSATRRPVFPPYKQTHQRYDT